MVAIKHTLSYQNVYSDIPEFFKMKLSCMNDELPRKKELASFPGPLRAQFLRMTFEPQSFQRSYTVEPPIKDTLNKGHNRKKLSVKNTL